MVRLLPLVPLALLAACEREPENIQEKAAEQARALEQRYKEIEAEAENRTAAQIAPLDKEAEALLNGLGGNEAEANIAAENKQEAP